MTMVEHLDRATLDAGVDHIRKAPKDNGRVELIVRRPDVEVREVLTDAVLDTSDQLFVDLDLSGANLPAGSQLRVGEATIEITALPRRGCGKFQARFGTEAL